ncbi:metallophosphoesterase [Alkalihalobacillus pseudalcaliphilus]|uniref:metallophosphoesterase n=1 Tax=Alkalihalobacillus pseudalcaliphilus TaxID=79884 RepID=UPI00064DEC54|nr:metallophosphoesterase [Alkalihalobacillus pseudalcaliphilus]KMK76470.1 hypothetical protein AB990_14905 [Alkalihalobacillus pseudalcaliphilus]
MKKIMTSFLTIGAIATFSYMYLEANRNRLLHHTLDFPTLPKAFDGYRLFFISDVHRRSISNSLLSSIGHCDAVIIGGDFTERTVPLQKVEANLQKLTQLADVYFVWGNNDVEADQEKLVALFDKYHVHMLENEVIDLNQEDERIQIVGVKALDKPLDHYSFYKKVESPFTILVSHFPLVREYLPEEHPFSLLLAGHTHGGQIRLFGWGLEDLGSLTQKKQLTTLISNGYGTSLLPLRLGAKSETHLIQLRNSSSN